MWNRLKNKIKNFIHRKDISYSINLGVFITGLMLIIIDILYKSNNIVQNSNYRTFIGDVFIIIAYSMFPLIDEQKKDKLLGYFSLHCLCIVICILITELILPHYLSGKTSNLGIEILCAVLSFMVLTYFAYILIHFGTAVYKVLKKFLTPNLDTQISDMTEKVERINKLVSAVTALIASLTPVACIIFAVFTNR